MNEIGIESKIGAAVLIHQEQKRQENERTAQERKEFGETFNSLRKTMRVSRRLISEKTGYSESTIGRLEKGEPVKIFETMKTSCMTALENFLLRSENQLKQAELDEANRKLNAFISEVPEICEKMDYESSIVTIKLPERGYFDGNKL